MFLHNSISKYTFSLNIDAEVGLNTAGMQYIAWYDTVNGEIGDLCNGQSGSYTACDGQTYSIQLEYSNLQGKCIPFPAPTCGSIVSTPTSAPVPSPTKAPVSPTKAPVSPTKAPVSPTKAPLGPTSAPVGPSPTKVPIITPTVAPSAPIAPQTIKPTTVNAIINPGFENGLTSWTTTGTTSIVTTGCNSGICVMAGATTATSGDSTISQTFTVPAGLSQFSFYYYMYCPDTVKYDWFTTTLVDNTANSLLDTNTLQTISSLPKKCVTSTSWTKVTGSVTAGHSYTLTLVSHDDGVSTDPSYTLFDSISLS